MWMHSDIFEVLHQPPSRESQSAVESGYIKSELQREFLNSEAASFPYSVILHYYFAMAIDEWIYVAPQRIRTGSLALPECRLWKQFENLNMQRLARVFEFQSCIGFVGSGVSACLGYPRWTALGRQDGAKGIVRELPALMGRSKDWIDPQQAIQIIEMQTGGEEIVFKSLKKAFFDGQPERKKEQRLQKAEQKHGKSPFPALLDLPIRRFVTTNYDNELEDELLNKFGPDVWSQERSFEQNDLKRLSIFAVALASENRNMVFHCHGTLKGEIGRWRETSRARRRMVLTDADYNHWYLSTHGGVYTLQRCLEITLQSNPVFFVGYSLSDVDLLRILRRAGLRLEPQRTASNLFLLLKRPKGLKDSQAEAWNLAKQIKFGVNLLPYKPEIKLAKELENRQREVFTWRQKWRLQPKVKPSASGPVGVIAARTLDGPGDSLFDPEYLKLDKVLDQIDEAMEGEFVVAITGKAGTGKLLKACQFVERSKDNYHRALVFHAFNNDDIYSYVKRITQTIRSLDGMRTGTNFRQNLSILRQHDKPLLLVVNNIDLLLGVESPDKWQPRNRLARKLIESLLLWNATASSRQKRGQLERRIGLRILLTARSLPQISTIINEIPTKTVLKRKLIRQISLDKVEAFSNKEVGLDLPEYQQLSWEIQGEHSGLILGANFLNSFKGSSEEERKGRLERMLRALRSNSSEMGTRVARHVMREMDAREAVRGRGYEVLLGFLACFNTPVAEQVFDATVACCSIYLDGKSRNAHPGAGRSSVQDETTSGIEVGFAFRPGLLNRLLEAGLVQALRTGAEGHRQRTPTDTGGELNYIVHPLVKRYFRQILERSQHYPEMEEFGLHGLLSRGPFNSPGRSRKAQRLFEYFVELAYTEIGKIIEKDPAKSANLTQTRFYIRALIDVLRSNFACNSVPTWGKFRDYMDMLSITIDLLKNFALSTGRCWEPGLDQAQVAFEAEDSKQGEIASAEEMLYLYNELGLGYYNTGSVLDALSVWSQAFDWQKAVSEVDDAQGEMYAASLHSHLGMAYLQLGRMLTASESFGRGLTSAKKTGNPDLQLRMEGMLGRISHFKGNTSEARFTYHRVIKGLKETGNHRAASYFMRHLSALEIRAGEFEKAKGLAQESRTIAASINAADLVAFSFELEGRVLSAQGKDKEAIRAYRIALEEARQLDISRLEADIQLGLANIQLRLGDASAARSRAIKAMQLANDDLLVLRQVKALILLGRAAAEFGDSHLARHTLQHAVKLANDSQFLLVEHDAKQVLAVLSVGQTTNT